MSTDPNPTGPDLRPASFVGYRPCPAREGFYELVVLVAEQRLTWCLPGPVDGAASAITAGTRVELQWADRTVRLAERLPGAAATEPISLARAVELLADERTELVVDDRLAALHA